VPLHCIAPYALQQWREGDSQQVANAEITSTRANSGQVADLADKNLLKHIDWARIIFDRVTPHGRKAR
jgi:hypothetical protein